MAVNIQLRRDNAATWTSVNPTLMEGELGYELDTGKFKIGDGSTAWTGLGYFIDSGGLAAHLADTAGAHAASAIAFSPDGGIAATDAQAAIVESVSDSTARLATHEADTLGIHGITDTSALYQAGGTDVAVADGGTGASTASGARTNLGLVIGTDIQNYDPDLRDIAALTPANDDIIQRKVGEWKNRTIAQLLTDLAGAGTTFQALDATLTALAAANWAADALPIGTGADTLAQTAFAANTFPAKASTGNLVAKPITDFGLSLVDDAAASNARTTLGLVIGTDVQNYDPDLRDIAALTPANDDIIQHKAGAWANRTMAQLIADLAALGTTFQSLDATLTALAGANWAANALPIGSGADTLAQIAFAANTFPARASTGNLVAKVITDFWLAILADSSGMVDGRDLGNLGPVANNSLRIFKGNIADTASFLVTGGTAYFVYVGYTMAAVTPIKAVVNCTVAGTSTQTAELGLFSTPSPPGIGNQTLTKIEATGTITSLLAPAEIVNTSDFSTSVPTGTHLWVGFRADMAGTEPTMRGISGLNDRINVLTTAASGALTAGGGTFAGVVPAFSTGVVGVGAHCRLDA